MKKHLFNIILAALILGTILGITSPVKSQGLVELAVLNVTGTLGNNGFYVSDVAYSWTLPDTAIPESIVGCESGTITQDTPPEGVFLLCYGEFLGGIFIGGIIDDNGDIQDPVIKRDATAPTISGSRSPAANAYGWNNTDVMVSFTCDDNLSGVASCGPDQTLSNEGAGQSAAGTAVDEAGNSAYTSVTGINIDKTAPSVSLVGGPADGASYSFGSVPAVPTCLASDALSGLVGSCSVSGYGTAVGTHTVTASATDMAGNSSSATSTYTVDPWYLSGFYQPVGLPNSFVVAAPGMLPTANSSTVWNSVKSGSTVPLKFHVFTANGGNEITTVSGAFNSSNPFSVLKITCSSNTNEDAVEFTTTGGTSLRYDAVEGQFIQNWQTPSKQAGSCYRTSLKTMDGSYLVAFFKLK